MENKRLLSSIEKLGKDFDAIEWKFLEVPAGSHYCWCIDSDPSLFQDFSST